MIIYAALLNFIFYMTPEWIYQYVYPSNTDEWPSAITIDNNGNSYTTGVICSDDTTGGHLTGIGVIKVNPSGQERWIYFMDILGRLNYGYDIKHKDNKLYVTGYVMSATEMRCVTLSIDTTMNERWLFLDTTAHGRGYAIALDSVDGVYAAGMIYGQATDIRVIKYDTLGSIRWRYVYDGPAASYDDPADIVADRWCNIYVGGYSTGDTTSTDYTIIKLDSAGNEKWVYRYDGPLHARDEITSLAVDTFGNIYACGSSGGDGWDLCAVSIDSGGNERWIYRLDGATPGGNDFGMDIVVDSIGSTYISGVCLDDSVGMFTVVKLDTAGQELWCYKTHGPIGFDGGSALRIAIDASGGIYAAGSFRNYEYHGQIAAVKLTATGDTVWTYFYPHMPVSPYSDATRDLAVDALGNAYLTGVIRVSQWDQDIVVMKFAGSVGINEAQKEMSANARWLPTVYRGGLRMSDRAVAGLSVYDITGRSVIRPGGHRGYIPLVAGVYFAILKEGSVTLKQKIVIVD